MKVIFFDFDLTLTENHTNGIPVSNEMTDIEIFGQSLKIIKPFFENLHKSGIIIFINTRGLWKEVKVILERIGLTFGKHGTIRNIYGAYRFEQIACQPIYTTDYWANKKSLFIAHGIKKLKEDGIIVSSQDVLLVDDTEKNIIVAETYGFNGLVAEKGAVNYTFQRIEEIINKSMKQ